MELLVLQLMHKVLGTQDLCLIQYIYSFKDNKWESLVLSTFLCATPP